MKRSPARRTNAASRFVAPAAALCLLLAPHAASATRVLTFHMSTTPSPALAGQDLSVTIDWTHDQGNCSGGTLVLSFPSTGLTYVNSSGGTLSGSTVQWSFPATHGGSRGGSFYASFRVSPSLPPGTNLSMGLTLSGSNCGFVGPPAGETEVPARPAAVLGLTKSASVTTVRPGDTVTYTLGYRNTGNTDAAGVVLTDTLPTGGLSFVSATGGGTEAGGVVTWSLGTVPHGGSGSVTLQARVNATSGAVANTSNITATNSAPASASVSVQVAQQPDLVLLKRAADTVQSGG